ncbi:MAG TPA: hypothetical protein VD816_09480, partial [Ohtaekwangia sp.]|nr:hypothetical protein [Ohtaekwangia sp.]
MIRLLCVLCFVSIDAFGQIAWVRDYYDKTDEKTDSASSYYFRIGKKSMNSAGVGMYIDTVSDFYTATGKKKSMEVYKEGLREGNFVHFHESGTVHARGSFIHGRLIGPVIRYYAHGGTQSTLEHSKEGDAVSPWHAIDYKIIDYWDSAGTQLVRAGNGYCKCYLYDEDGQNFLERGK